MNPAAISGSRSNCTDLERAAGSEEEIVAHIENAGSRTNCRVLEWGAGSEEEILAHIENSGFLPS